MSYCQGRRRWETELGAQLAMLKGRDNEPGRAYECKRCKGWHLTSMPR